ncbi:MAG TPA: hypothetical protein VOA41_01805 [Candidatus Dormibacteraeota bacterium]|nr:hypothetical protein [Candidatus Dormibacteraeota bacterium]
MRRNSKLRLAVTLLMFAPIQGLGEPAATSTSTAVLLRADFAKELPADFQQLGGLWRAGGGTLRATPSGGVSLLAFGEPDLTDYSASVHFRTVGAPDLDSEGGLALNLKDGRDYIVFALRQKKSGPYLVLRTQLDAGMMVTADQSRLPKSFDPTQWHELRADVHGVDVSCLLGGKHVMDYSFEGTPPPYYAHGKTWQTDLSKGRIGLLVNKVELEFKDLQVDRLADPGAIVTSQRGKRDKHGRLLPRQSYAETMRSYTNWMLESNEIVDKEKAPAPIRDLPPYLLTNFSSSDDKLLNVGGEFAFNHALFISGAIRYYVFNGDQRPIKMAQVLADWDIANSTPADAAAPYLPPSVVNWQQDGSWKPQGWGLEPDKSAYMATTYLKLSAVTGEKKYLDAAVRVAKTLEKLQGADGGWPFRVNPKSGEVEHGYTCSQLWYVWLFEQLAEVTGDTRYLEPRNKAFRWLLENPLKTNLWMGLYGDIPSGAKSYDQWVPLETAMYLLDHRSEDSGYVAQAKAVLDWVNRTLVVYPGLHRGVPGLIEQSTYQVTLTHHELRLAEMYSELWDATGEQKYKELAVEIANSVTWGVMSDGKMRQGFWYHAIGIPLILEFNDQFARIMANIPETAPRHENHILQTSNHVRWVRYEERQVRYQTIGRSEDILTVVGFPKSVRAAGMVLQPVASKGSRWKDGWRYDIETNRLEIHHSGSEIKIEF